ncbi:MAG: cytochrome ubiquinol oxidase subunit I, partial [bacterium]
MDDLMSARLQMAISLGFHIVFAMIGIGMPVLMTLAEARWIRTGSETARNLARAWAKGTAIFFAVGAVSGTVLSVELGLLWPAFMEHAGGIIGLPFGLEGFAFFTEGIFLGVYLYGWDRIPRRAHLAAGIVVAISGALSAVFIIMVNAWMNTPEGFRFDAATGVFSDIDPLEAMITPHWAPQFIHQLLAAYAAVGFAVAGVHAFGLLRGRAHAFHGEALRLAMWMAVPAALLLPVSGHWAAQRIAQWQPAKLAAMEGQFETQASAPLRIGGLPFEEEAETRWALEIPGALSVLAFNDFEATVTGLDAFPREDWPPVAVVHLSFQL